MNNEGSFDCVCSAGYQLSQDGRSCELVTTAGLPTVPPTSGGNIQTLATVSMATPFSTSPPPPTISSTEGAESTNHEETQPTEATDGQPLSIAATTKMEDIVEATTKAAVTVASVCIEAGCQHSCLVSKDSSSAECVCLDGYALGEDGKSCDDVDECVDGNGGCGFYCWNTPGSYQCMCRKGYALESDGKTCKGKIHVTRTPHEVCTHTVSSPLNSLSNIIFF